VALIPSNLTGVAYIVITNTDQEIDNENPIPDTSIIAGTAFTIYGDFPLY
jgi:hypothetical protein